MISTFPGTRIIQLLSMHGPLCELQPLKMRNIILETWIEEVNFGAVPCMNESFQQRVLESGMFFLAPTAMLSRLPKAIPMFWSSNISFLYSFCFGPHVITCFHFKLLQGSY